jgi:hypothetical protein
VVEVRLVSSDISDLVTSKARPTNEHACTLRRHVGPSITCADTFIKPSVSSSIADGVVESGDVKGAGEVESMDAGAVDASEPPIACVALPT